MTDPVMTDLARHLGEVDAQQVADRAREAQQDEVYDAVLAGKAHDFAEWILGRGSLDVDELLSLLQVLLLGEHADDEAARMRTWLDGEVASYIGGK